MGQIIHSNYSVPGRVLHTLARIVKKQSKNTAPTVFTSLMGFTQCYLIQPIKMFLNLLCKSKFSQSKYILNYQRHSMIFNKKCNYFAKERTLGGKWICQK